MKKIVDRAQQDIYSRLGCGCQDQLDWLLDQAIAAKDLVKAHLFCKRMKKIVDRAAQQFLRNATV
jgi:hypothetical protein